MNDSVRIPLAEAIGTAVLVIAGPGTAIFATGGFNESLNVTIMGVALAFGLSLMCMASGCCRWRSSRSSSRRSSC